MLGLGLGFNPFNTMHIIGIRLILRLRVCNTCRLRSLRRRSPNERRLRGKEEERHRQHREEDSTGAKCPAISSILDNIATDDRPSRDPSCEKQAPECKTGGSFMDKVHIANGALHKNLNHVNRET